MKKSILISSATLATLLMVASCGGSTSGPAEKVLNKKVYAQVVNKYDDVGYFVDGICIVKAGWNQYGAINNKGEEIIPTNVYYLGKVVEGMIVAEDKDYKYGAYNTKGELVIPFKYDEVENYSSGLARVKTGGYSNTKYGYVDKAGNEVVAAKYDQASKAFHEGLAYIATRDGWDYKYGFINPKGEEVVPLMYKDAENFSDGMAAVRTKNGWGYINTKGELVTAAKYDDCMAFNEGFAAVAYDKVVAVINKKGEEQFQFPKNITPAGSYHDGVILVVNEKTEKFGYFDTKGEMVLPLEFAAADGFRDGKALTARAEKGEVIYEFIDKNGKVTGTIDDDTYTWDYEDVEDAFYLAVEKVENDAENGKDSSSSKSISSSNDDSNNWDELLDEYEKFVDKYIAMYKKAMAGDMTALSSYADLLKSAEDISEKLENAEDDLTTSQLSRYMNISQKLTTAALDAADE